MLTDKAKNQHLMWRAGFGPAASQITTFHQLKPLQLYKALQQASAKAPDYIDVADNYLKGLFMGIEAVKPETPPQDRKMVRQKQREGIKNLNLYWLNQMVESNAQLREKMAFFWHGHFATRNINIFYQQQLLHTLRTHALGSFRELLHEVSRSAAMLNFLNAAQNKKGRPNENFAREVMELFTLGRGHYTEHDVRDAARAFTGWSANVKGEFVFRPFQHDSGEKTVLGKKGNFSGEEVLDLLLDQRQTAHFISGKIYRFFVNEKPDAEKIAWLSNRFYGNDYNIAALMEDIFTADWFYDEKNIGTRIKSPVELLAGIQRMLPMEVENEESLLVMQRLLGQLLFYPPNVAGWPGGRAWIDSSTLMMRLRLPLLLNDVEELQLRPKNDDDLMMGRPEGEALEETAGKRGYGKASRPVQAVIEWDDYTKLYESIPRESLLAALSDTLLQNGARFPKDLIRKYTDDSSRAAFIKTATIQLMSTPEYQLC